MKTSRASLPRIKAIALAVATCFAATPWTALHANPQTPQVVAGQAVFQQTGSTLTVTNTPGAIINWQSFNIDRGELTRFVQQNAASQVLNRVIGSADPSQILGSLQSNGRVLLINPNGVVFGRGSQVDVAGLVVSSLNLSNEDFLGGKLRFTSNGAAGAVKTEGSIKTASGGSVVLIAPRVENSGIIQTPEGTILLAAGRSVEIVDLERRDIRVEVTNSEQQAINLGSLLAKQVNLVGGLVKNSGVIQASTAIIGENGKVVLKGRYAAENTGTIQANGAQGGDILIQASEGQVTISGTVEAKGVVTPPDATLLPGTVVKTATGQGGRIEILAQSIQIDQATIDASGDTGGGAILIGGDFRGGSGTLDTPWAQNAAYQRASIGNDIRFVDSPVLSEASTTNAGSSNSGLPLDDSRPQQPALPNRSPLQTARTTYIGASSRIRADATQDGNGGTIILWSNESTESHATISAVNAGTGSGGLVESSSRGVLKIDHAPQVGKGGLWLIDPYDITVVDTDSDGDSSLTPSSSNTTIAASLIVSVLNDGGNVTLDTSGDGYGTAAGDININAAINKTSSIDASLTLNAHQNIYLNAPITSNSGKLDLNLNADIDRNGSGQVHLGNTTINLYGGTINAANSLVEVNFGNAEINSAFSFGQLTLNGGSLTLKTGLAQTLSAPLVVNGGTLTADDDLTVMQLHWSGGTIMGSGKLITPSTAYSLLDGAYTTKTLKNKQWDNAGLIELNSGTLLLAGEGFGDTAIADGATLNNLPTGVLRINPNGLVPIIGSSYYSTAPTLNNQGTIFWNYNWEDFSVDAIQNITFNNSGHLNVQGELRLESVLATNSGLLFANDPIYPDGPTYYGGRIFLQETNLTINPGGQFGADYQLRVGYNSNLQLTENTTLSGLVQLYGGTINTPNTLTIQQLMWSSGTITGGGILVTPTYSSHNVSGSAILRNVTWNNSGYLDLFGTLTLYSDSATPTVFNNQASGTVNISNNYALQGSSSSSVKSQFNNSGTTNWWSPSGTGISNLDLSNTGLINISGNLDTQNTTLTSSGTINLQSASSFTLYNSTLKLNQGNTFTGSGSISIPYGSTLEVSTPSNIQNPLYLEGTILGHSDLTLAKLYWTGGTITGEGILETPTGSEVHLSNNTGHVLQNKVWNNSGLIDISEGSLVFYGSGNDGGRGSGAYLNNLAGGIINVTSSSFAPLEGYSYYGEPVQINNFGTINWDATYTDSFYSPRIQNLDFNNFGTVNLNQSLTLSGTTGIDQQGWYNIAAGKELSFSSGYRQIDGNTIFSGDGAIRITDNSYIYFSSPSTLLLPLYLSGGTLSSNYQLNIKTLYWLYGSITGNGLLVTPSDGVATLIGSGYMSLDNKPWDNYGTINLRGGSLALNSFGGDGLPSSSVVLHNRQGGVINQNSSSSSSPIYGTNYYGYTPSLINEGTINWNGYAANYDYSELAGVDLYNHGLFNVNANLYLSNSNGVDSGSYVISQDKSLVLYDSYRNLINNASISGNGTLIIGDNSYVAISSDPGKINPSLIHIANGTVLFNSSLSNAQLNTPLWLEYGWLDITGNLAIKNLHWSGGNIGGSGNLITPTDGIALLDSPDTKTLSLSNWDNAGQIQLTEGQLYLGNYNYASFASTEQGSTFGTTVLTNQATGHITVSSQDSYAIQGISYNRPIINNFGTIDWNSITEGYSTISDLTFNNYGTFNANKTLGFNFIDGEDSGTYNIASGSNLILQYASRNFLSGAKLNGAGTITVQGGSNLYFSDPLVINPTLVLSGGYLEVPTEITVNKLIWNSGQIASGEAPNGGKLITPTGAYAKLATSGTKYFENMLWENSGTIDINEGYIYFNINTLASQTPSSTGLRNNSSGVVNINGAVSYNDSTPYLSLNAYGNSGFTPSIDNFGTINWQPYSPSNTNFYGFVFNNHGLFNILKDMNFYGLSGNDTGTYQIATGVTFGLSSAYRSFSSTANITGAGTLNIYSGSVVDILGNFDIANTGYVNIYGGQLNLASTSGSLTFNNPFNISDGTLNASNDVTFKHLLWNGGNMTGSGKLITPLGGIATLDSTGSKQLIGKTWENQGTINFLNGTLYLESGYYASQETPSEIRNLTSGIFNISTPAYAPLYTEYANNTLFNDGTINWQANLNPDNSSHIIGVPVINNGVLNIFGSNAFAKITTSLQQNGTLALHDNASLWLPNLTNTGTISGVGSINLADGYGKLINTGVISPGGDGIIGNLNLIGDADLSNGLLKIDVQGNTSGTYDLFHVSGNLTLGGTLATNLPANYAPTIGDFAPFLTQDGQSSGTFAQALTPPDFVVGYRLAAGESSRLIYGGSSTRVFTNAYGGLNWENPGNWSGNILPRSTDDVLISSAGNAYAVTHGSGNDQIRNLTINTGNSLDISGGSLTVSGITDLTGLLSVSGSGQATLEGALQGGSSGQVVVNGGALYLNGPSSIKQLNLNGGSLGGSGTLDISDMSWSSALSGSGPVNVYGTLAINPGASRSSGLFNNYGTATMASTYFGVPLNDGAIFNNYGKLNINSNAEFWQGSGLASPVNTAFNPYNYYGNGFEGATGSRFVNQAGGIFNRNDSVNGSIFYGLAFDNFGTLNFGNGDLALRAGGTLAGKILRNGTSLGYLVLQGGDFNLSGELGTNAQILIQDVVGLNPQVHINANLQLAQGARIERQSGLLDWTNGWLQLDSGSTLATQGQDFTIPTSGTLAGTGTIDVGSGTLINQGNLLPGGDGLIGTLNILGNYSQASSGNLNIDLASSTQADQLNVSGNLAVDGTLTAKTLAGYTPQEREVIPFLFVGGTGSGSFSNLNLPNGFIPSYNRSTGEWTRLIYSTTGQNVFTNAQGSNTWENPLNWLFGLPQASDNVLISGGNAVTHSSGNDSIATLTVDVGNSLALLGGSLSVSGLANLNGGLLINGGSLNLNGTAYLQSLDLAAGSLYANDLHLLGASHLWRGGSLSGQVEIANGATFDLSGGTRSFSSGLLRNLGTLNFNLDANADLSLGQAAQLENAGDLLFSGSNNGLSTLAGQSATGLLNTGTLRVATGQNARVTTDNFTTTGSLLVESGATLQRPQGFTNQGELSGHGTIDVGSSTLLNQGSILPGGDGVLGTLTILGNFSQASTGTLNIDLAGAGQADKLLVTGNLAVDGTLTAKTLTGYTPQEGDVASILGFGGTGSGSFSNLSLPSGFIPSYNRAAGEWTRLIYSTTGQNIFTNAQGGNTWENPLNWLFGLPQASDNVLISGGNAVTHNSGNDSIASLSIDAGNSLAILGGSLSIGGLTKVLGTLSASSNQMLHLGTNSEINQLNIGDSFTFSSGSALIRQLQAQGLNVQGGSVTLGSTTTDASSLNGGALTVSGGSLILGGGNVDVGTANITAPGQLLYQGGQLTGLSSMSNTGTLSFGNTTITYPVFNTGTINLSGGVTFNRLFTNQGGTLSMAGTNTFLAGLTQDAGVLTLLNGTIVGDVNLNGGFLGGSGTIQGALNVGSATVAPGFSPGSLTINGNLNLSASSSLLFEIGGDQAGVTYDQLVVNGNALLAGQLTTVNYGTYTPQAGIAYDVMRFNSSTGQFANVSSQNGLSANLLSSGMQFTLPGVPASMASAPPVVLASNSVITSMQNVMLEEDGGLVVGVSSPQPSPIQSAQEDKKSEEPLPACP